MKECNGVFEGGGVRGIGHVGAACKMESAGYRFVDLAGSSAGAIVAALLAAGYTCGELKTEMESVDYMKFEGKGFPDHFGTVGKALSILMTLGIYGTEYLEEWMEGLLKKKGMTKFADVERTGKRLKITASDLTERRLLVLPDDLGRFGAKPASFSIAAAVRMSVSIPVFFEPYRFRDRQGNIHMIVDGGLLSNYPVWLLDDGTSRPTRPTFGFKFVDARGEKTCMACTASPHIADYFKSIVSTSLDAIDNSHMSRGDYERTIRIPTEVELNGEKKQISATDFDISREESRALFDNGERAASGFLKDWDFDKWKRIYRPVETRRVM